jgi:basic membrane protein A
VNRRVALGLVAAAAGATLLPARKATPPARPGASRIGLVFDVGGRGDKSFNDAAYAGLTLAAERHGIAFELAEPSGSEDREGAMRLFASRGFDLVIGVGHIFSRDVTDVARAFPRVRFACVDYSPPPVIPDNLAGLAFREEDGSFLVGAAAALTSKTGHVGFVGGMNVDLIQKFEAGYRAGALAARPSCVIHAAYAGTSPDAFRDPAKGKAIAASQIAAGADVVYHAAGSTGSGVFEAAREAKVLAIGVDRDQFDEMPGVILTSMVKRVDVAVAGIVGTVVDGSFRGGMRVFGLREAGVDWVHEGPHAALLAPATITAVEALRVRIVAGEIVVPSRGS